MKIQENEKGCPYIGVSGSRKMDFGVGTVGLRLKKCFSK